MIATEHTCGGRGDVPCPGCTALAAQAAYVKRWREAHPDELWGRETWACPLCGCVEQADKPGQDFQIYYVQPHRTMHGRAWLDYERLAAADAGLTTEGD